MKIRLKSRFPALFILFVLLYTLPGCKQKAVSKSPPERVIIISIDALRADHLGCYGYSRKTSPFIDEFAKESVIFENAVTPRPKTTPSLVSMLSGQYPYRHGVRNLNHPLKTTIGLPVSLKKSGLNTAAFVSNWVLRPESCGLEKSFDVYNAKFTQQETNRKNVFQRTAAETNTEIFEWLGKNHKQPFFLWVHYIDPHGPYNAPKPHDDVFHHKNPTLRSAELVPEYQRLATIPVVDGLTDIQNYIDQYDNEINYNDQQVGQLIKRLRSLDLVENSLVIITSDHGESLGQHDYYFEHGRELYDDCSKIPLIVRFPSSSHIEGGKRVDALVSLMDIYPTVLDVLNINNKPDQDIDGKSMLPLVQGKSSIHDEIFIEHYKKNEFSKTAIRTHTHKLITFDDKPSQCFDLKKDPAETNPKGCATKTYENLSSRLTKLRDTAILNGKSLPKKENRTKHEFEALKNLGYLQ
jgi:arylsulfatase A-like enzyme